MSAFLRQHGKSLFTADGLGFENADAVSWFDFNMSLQNAKVIPSPDEVTEDAGKSLDQSSLAVGKLAMGFVWSNQVSAFDNASGEDIKILRYPSQTGKAADAKLWYKASMFWSASSRTKQPEEVAKFIAFLSNSLTAGPGHNRNLHLHLDLERLLHRADLSDLTRHVHCADRPTVLHRLDRWQQLGGRCLRCRSSRCCRSSWPSCSGSAS